MSKPRPPTDAELKKLVMAAEKAGVGTVGITPQRLLSIIAERDTAHANGRAEMREEAAKVTEACVEYKCCGKLIMKSDDGINLTGEECCGNPEAIPWYPDQIADAIRNLP